MENRGWGESVSRILHEEPTSGITTQPIQYQFPHPSLSLLPLFRPHSPSRFGSHRSDRITGQPITSPLNQLHVTKHKCYTQHRLPVTVVYKCT
ncbi:hypothetical protein CH063_07932 [Colletotrichum higginsianum]|uniref:Uncharacterized protein n=1 Tax=Colletotrichum higginsianum (strain IMI 349063) TaxID=759273 RepID=H1V7Y6_COLHI|nr:hypothetical protein CH63R_01156 [Colletotrichum higginsianum IMI 349063]OBR15976.1 hypothetical protein CH63R_01156 [Colletotrichum higginsianum IMI 349063]CCF36338.1 hypothetical protein CH063_07932 [Colletotrichum higginsianum]